MSDEQGRAEALSADERIAAVLLNHGHPGELLTVLGDAWMTCGCGHKITIAVHRGEAQVGEANREWAAHVAAALRAEWEAQANTDRAAVERAEIALVRANAILNSYGIHGQLWHDLSAIIRPAVAALATQPGEPS